MFRSLCLVATGLCLAATPHAYAQNEWPVKPVRIIVPSSPGGGTDTIARLLGAHFSSALGQQFVIDNRAGAAGLIGYQIAARTAGDGYTLLVAPTTITSIHLVTKNPQFEVTKDFAPITQVVASTQALVVHPSLPAKSVQELVALAKKSPDLTFASPGEGSVPHLAMELLKLMTGTQMTHVPYKGVSPALTDVIGGRVSAMLVNVISAKPHIDAGRLRALAVSARKRADALPSVPTVTEAGYGDYEALQWFGLFATAGTPPRILSRLHTLTVAALREPETKKRLADEEPIGNSPEEFAKVIRAEVAKWTKVARAAKLQAS
ncbi:MAG TPA: tripartite tricarboxylate transporter substrate binding protein [Burkholderiales bacterium]|nr:tripartite tricarboxylate transporter substrate binding protein [Burkholderiales bacterium]